MESVVTKRRASLHFRTSIVCNNGWKVVKYLDRNWELNYIIPRRSITVMIQPINIIIITKVIRNFSLCDMGGRG